ncbi:putative Peptidase M23 [Vibrio nigripulchritudo SFn27]|uniref:Putative Peptidase M23 n=1 Tax=Vibrio nigripulchritudo TaxID=28173 RepID=U4KCR4_9VIBR|nr:M23 family metallopeptidase [Vibrio nigripulchritudo]CCN34956.1 putative Peptidase M23 [Vibrio nigripulchritudo AM115]CCN40286.1 putative Peptidase M23 [Vibrio nigripulchritudo FTn2]CCN67796.1 putative Peptidase M23 [Vibrio nigripulchritudo POn4]CCN71334.1 putative Peptidase M23 [Vibrio nigripulchritudo SFn118]CCN78507.1 putative Peptidase M23 [Vibrio nigripulchritudo SO65]
MSRKIQISIPTSSGVQHFFVGRKATAGILLSLFALPSFLGTSIYQYLSAKDYAESSLARAEQSFVHAQTQIDYLDQKSDQFKALYEAQISANHSLTQELEEKKGEILTLGKRVNDVESVLGITQETSVVDYAELSLEQRIDAAAIDSAVRATMFRLLPNDSPVIYQRISSSYGYRKNPITGKRHRHLGIDLTCQRGEQVLAPADGVVELRRPSREGYGNLLKLRHAFGFMTSYAHLQSFKVRSGQFVKKGDVVATCGNSGNSTGPHLHYEVRFLGRTLNPKHFMDWTPDSFDTLFEKERSIKWASLVDVMSNVVKLQVLLTQNPSKEPDSVDTVKNATETEVVN